MNSVQLLDKIEMLPLSLQAQIADFVDFLVNRHFQQRPISTDESDLSREQLNELDRRYQEYLDNPESVIDIDILKNQLFKNYGIQTQD